MSVIEVTPVADGLRCDCQMLVAVVPFALAVMIVATVMVVVRLRGFVV